MFPVEDQLHGLVFSETITMKMTTLCYIEKDDCYLMLLRNKKINDINEGKWIGVGGKFLPGESPEECLIREVKEETGLTLTRFKFRGFITFVQNKTETEYMCLFTANEFSGDLMECDEGELRWIPKDKIGELNLWEGDRVFLELLRKEKPFFLMKLEYEEEELISHSVRY